MHVALTVAGSDSGGGAGIQADLRTFQHFGVFGVSALTAITAQNTAGIRCWEAVSPRMVRAQIDAVAEDYSPLSTKSGMIGNRDIARELESGIRENGLRNYVLDPVMFSTTGTALFDGDALETITNLIPLAALVTPNLREAESIAGFPVRGVSDMARAAEWIVTQLGADAVLVTGGHLDSGIVTDVLFAGGTGTEFRNPRIPSGTTHGTGCNLSAAICAQLATGVSLETAIPDAIAYVRSVISRSLDP